MKTKSNLISTIDKIVSEATSDGLAQLVTEDEFYDGRTIRINGKRLLNFSLCSYLGLELDARLRQGTIDAVASFGTQFAASRAYLSVAPYAELESMLDRLFGGYTLATPTTTLGHIAALPVLIQAGDAVILDQMVHNSVQTAAKLVQANGIYVETVRHNRLDLLEARISELSKQYRSVWYLADGVYSMFGDLAPVEELGKLLNRYEQLHLYFDDAHGMSWIGKHGRGYVLDLLPIQERMVVATSLSKAFAAGGGALIFPNSQMHRLVRNCGGPMTFSTPISPPMLGAAVASARIHLSSKIVYLQKELQDRVSLCNYLLQKYNLPLASSSQSPIFYIKLGLPDLAANMVKVLLNQGFHTSYAVFPAVPLRKSGIRFTVTRHHSADNIRGLVEAIASHLPLVLAAEKQMRADGMLRQAGSTS